jgi:hypothetical protein
MKIRQIGPQSRPLSLARIDGRTKAAKLMASVRSELTSHVGGAPNFPQRCLIERAAVLAVRLAAIEEKIIDGEPIDNDRAIAWFNAHRRTIAALGLQPASTQAQPTLTDYLTASHGHEAA